MNVSKNLKLMLMKLGRQGHDVSLIQEQRYSRDYDSVYTRYKLTFWIEGERKNKKTGEVKRCIMPDTCEFNSAIELLQYMVVIANE
ncbi:hypothetical protein M5X00_31895 [Paenibacillus alvei]|uniref:hypothetical protein n=1 Tax=Paenibacillus alvei TaxID=44250 RepID=UPI00028925BE|nr:hypothetical protein [Paenibacillus alvei]EJW14299.1 hypothetical protein PAV_15c00880 [Paenibacillus alvei DSM 29]MCY9539219.1 hypothetical protein [Paenibacillus alvei]MCY9706735.1 hypothetical protein [Paenibacillus alvei]MCY9737012.1 hypothetical protein [Paenibacillus alvei]MCY9758822.1 hypothetical protein [Paenibacillus alvei]